MRNLMMVVLAIVLAWVFCGRKAAIFLMLSCVVMIAVARQIVENMAEDPATVELCLDTGDCILLPAQHADFLMDWSEK